MPSSGISPANGTVVIKFHLHTSKEEQKRGLLARLDEPAKRWKFSIDDVEERTRWDRHMCAYEDRIRHTSTREVPWYVVPADKKWFARLVIAIVIVDVLDRLDLQYPRFWRDVLQQMRAAQGAGGALSRHSLGGAKAACRTRLCPGRCVGQSAQPSAVTDLPHCFRSLTLPDRLRLFDGARSSS
jgi:hypothetical protein